MWPFKRRATEIETKGTLASPSDLLLEFFSACPATSGIAVTPKNAMTCAPVRGAVQAISEAIGQVPVHVYQHGDNDAKERAPAAGEVPIVIDSNELQWSWSMSVRMSGWVQKRISEIFLKNFDHDFSIPELAGIVFGTDKPTFPQLVSIRRAAREVAKELGWVGRKRLRQYRWVFCYVNSACIPTSQAERPDRATIAALFGRS